MELGTWSTDGGWRRALLVVGPTVLVAALLVAGALAVAGGRRPDVIVGAVATDVSLPAPAAPAATAAPVTPEDDGPGVASARRPRATGQPLLRPDGRPYGSPVPFDASIPVPADLVWVLVVGTDARPGEEQRRARADSIHLIGANPRTGQATVIGVPRDSWIDVPGHGTQKINQATVLGGPELLARALHAYLGLPVQWWVLAGFSAFVAVVDAVGGVDVEVTQRMDDHASEARFEPGYHHMDGARALAYSRDRHDFADGDFTRTGNQGRVALAALGKLRAEVGDESGLRRWVTFALRHLATDGIGFDEALRLMAVARRTDPALTTNLVLPGRAGNAGGQSVVLLDAARVARIADDVRPDAAVGAEGRDQPGTPSTTSRRPMGPTTTTAPTTSTTAEPTTTTTTETTEADPD